MESVRPAGPGDVARCTELLVAAAVEADARRGGTLLVTRGADVAVERPADLSTLVARWVAGGDHRLVVGSIDEVPVGVAAGTLTGSARDRLGLVECCYVEPGARQVGLGTALMADLVAWFADRGCRGVDAWALPGDRATKQLLEAAGLSARLLVLHRRLP